MAQDNSTPTLRQLAEANHIHIGAAAGASQLDNALQVETLPREFNMLTPENEAKPVEIQPELGTFTFSNFDRLVAFAEQNNMMVHGHTLLWHQQIPAWLENGPFTRDEAIQILHDTIFTILGRYRGRVAIWDVVNEAIDDSGNGLRDTPWRRWIGDDYVELAFRFAHEADPDALLFYNDYGGEGLGAKSDAICQMVSDFVARGVPINGVGFQSHFTVGGFNVADIASNMKRLGELGLQVQITEFDDRYNGDVTDDILRRQAADYYNLMDTCLNHDNCTAFITWGVSDLNSWLRSENLGFFENPNVDPLMFDDNYQPKPAYYAVLDALATHAGEPPILTDDERNTMLGIQQTDTNAIPEPTKSDPAQLAPDPVPGQVYYAPFPVTITLDGNTDDWANIPRVTVDNGPTLPDNNDTVLTFAAAADDTNLYFLADVQDSHVVYGNYDPASGWYREDSVEFYINATGKYDLTSYQPGVAQIGILAANVTHPDAPIIGGSNSADSHVSVYATLTDTGYRIEAAVPLVTDVWTIEPANLGQIGFQVHLNGSSGDDRDTKLIWSANDPNDQSYTNPSLFGRLIFWDKNQ